MNLTLMEREFNILGYLSLNKDVKDALINPLLHYIKYGQVG